VDFVELVVHVFEPEHRLYYDLESLWGEGHSVAWERPMGTPPPIPRGGDGS
jgi:ribosomal silencing factor RsfS